jgi:pimeloyl-ACP methyl ester carboxylesterase
MAQASTPLAGMHVTVAGEGSPALVFVHGFACDSTDWTAQADALVALTIVVSCDLAAHGGSPGSRTDSTIAAYGAAVARLLEELGLESAILVGHSMGCRVVLECSRMASARLAGIVLLDGSRIGIGDPTAAAQRMAAELDGAGYDAFMRSFFGAMFVPSSDPALHDSILDRALLLPPDVGRHLLADLARWDAGDMEAALSGIAAPVLAIQTTTLDVARERVSLSADGESAWLDLVRSHVPGVQVATLADAGHFPHIENADEVTALIADFFEQVAGERAAR